MTITLLLLIPVIIAITGFISVKSVQLGLRWQVEVKQEQPPTMKPIPNPIANVLDAKQEKEVESIVDEWFNGAKESR